LQEGEPLSLSLSLSLSHILETQMSWGEHISPSMSAWLWGGDVLGRQSLALLLLLGKPGGQFSFFPISDRENLCWIFYPRDQVQYSLESLTV
jgi:hypothetical protein